VNPESILEPIEEVLRKALGDHEETIANAALWALTVHAAGSAVTLNAVVTARAGDQAMF
jgi:hypothetical protein